MSTTDPASLFVPAVDPVTPFHHKSRLNERAILE